MNEDLPFPGLDVRAAYDEVAARYLEGRHRFDNSAVLAHIQARVFPPASVLDIGCGAGVPISAALVAAGYRVQGIDISPVQIGFAEVLVPGGTFVVKDVLAAAPGEFSVEAVVAIYSLYHVERELHGRLYTLIRSFLPPGGVFVALLAANELDGHEADFHGTRMRWSAYAPHEEILLMERAGFRIESADEDGSGGERHVRVLAVAD